MLAWVKNTLKISLILEAFQKRVTKTSSLNTMH